jgi:predicted transcriptional regulator
VKRDDSERAHVYAAALSQRQAQKRFLGKVLQREFEGSAAELVMQALGSGRPASADELAMIRARLNELEEKHK